MRIIYSFLVFLGLVLLVLPISVPILKTSAEFSMFNTRWDGCAKFAELLHQKGEIVPLMYPYNSVKVSNLDGALIIVGPDVEFSGFEAEEVKRFLENGGTVFVADDFGTANTLLDLLGVNVKFSESPLNDIFYTVSGDFPVVVRIKESSLSLNTDKVTLNIPSAVIGSEGEIFSSKVSVVGKSMGSFPILAEIRYGNGRIILLSDPSILINDMFDENKKFIENLITYIGENKYYFDEAHHSDFNPYIQTTVFIHRELDKERAFQVFLAVAAIAAAIESGFFKKISDMIVNMFPRRDENLLEGLPEWVDRLLLEKIIEEIKKGSKLGEAYGRKTFYGKSGKGNQ